MLGLRELEVTVGPRLVRTVYHDHQALDSPTSESERLARPLAGGGAASSAQPALGASQAEGEQAALPAY